MALKRYIDTEWGLSLIETLVALGFLAFALTGFSYIMPYGWRFASAMGSHRLAVMAAEGKLENLSGKIYNGAQVNGGTEVITIEDRNPPLNDLWGRCTWTNEPSPYGNGYCKRITVTVIYPTDAAGNPMGYTKQIRLAKIITPWK